MAAIVTTITRLPSRPHWAIECLDREEAHALLERAPAGSHVEVSPKEAGELVILWVPIPDEVLEAEGFGFENCG